MHHANYYALLINFKNKSDFFLTMISRLNCLPLPDYVPVELHRDSWIERAGSREKVMSFTYKFKF